MERLTKRDESGKAECIYKKKYVPGMNTTLCDEKNGCHWCGYLPKSLEHLAAYEEIGTVDEFKALKQRKEINGALIDAYTNLVDQWKTNYSELLQEFKQIAEQKPEVCKCER